MPSSSVAISASATTTAKTGVADARSDALARLRSGLMALAGET
jgi:hypothetical protein